MSPRSAIRQVTNPGNEYSVASYSPRTSMVGQEHVHRHLDTALHNFQPTEGSSAWFCALTSTGGDGKMRTADALVSEATGKSSGWIDRTGAQLTPTPAAGFCRRHTVTDGVIQMVIRQAEDAGRRLPFTEWIPWVSLAARIALQDRANPQLHTILDYLETLGAGCTGGV